MANSRLGVITYGCSDASRSRDDLRSLLPGTVIDESAILDTVPVDVLNGWRADENSSEATVVHLADGSEMTVRTEPLLELAELAANDLIDAGADVLLHGCAGPLPNWPSIALTISPYRLLQGYLDGIMPYGRVGLVVPSPLHVGPTIARYSTGTRAVTCIAAAPIDDEAVAAALDQLTADGADLLVLTCFDHTLGDLRSARARVDVPLTSSRRLAVAALQSILDGVTEA